MRTTGRLNHLLPGCTKFQVMFRIGRGRTCVLTSMLPSFMTENLPKLNPYYSRGATTMVIITYYIEELLRVEGPISAA